MGRLRLIELGLQLLHLSLRRLQRLLELNRTLNQEIRGVGLPRNCLFDQCLGLRVFLFRSRGRHLPQKTFD
jgi:hypothetical protein